MAKTFIETHIDIPAIEADLAAIEPPTITLNEVLVRLAPTLVAAHRKGATAEQIRDRLKAHKIQASVAAINDVIEAKSKPARKAQPGAEQPATRTETTAPAPAAPAPVSSDPT